MNKPILVANWKMNGNIAQGEELINNLNKLEQDLIKECQLVICPPFTLLNMAKNTFTNQNINIGAQDCANIASDYGAYTGDISAAMIADLGCKYVILGHSERRNYHQETNEIVRHKAEISLKAGLIPIICVGESLADRKNGNFIEVIKEQLLESLPSSALATNTIIAYEPIWSIGTGLVPSKEQIEEIFNFIHHLFEKNFKLIYGGSVNHNNCRMIISCSYVDGLLVGGASLEIQGFSKIIQLITNQTE